MSKDLQMQELISEFDKSGKSRNDFCIDAGIGIHKFKYWEKKIRSNSDVSSGFVQIRTKPSAKLVLGFEIEYPNGVTLRMKNEQSLEMVRSLINLL